VEHTGRTAARRAQIVRAAIETIAELGYDQATFAKITERAGLSSPRMISYHFDSKDDLIHEILVHVFTAGARYIAEQMEAEDTAVGKLRAYLEANLRFIRDHPRDMAALTEIGPHLRDAAGRRYTSVGAQEVSVQGLEKLLSDGCAGGEFRDLDVRSMAVLVRGAIDGVARRLREEPDFDFDSYAREAVTTFTRAVVR